VAGVALAAIATALVCPPARAQWSMEGGVEYYDWTEDTAPIAVHEHGPRFLVAGGWMLPKKQGPLIGYRGEFYGGVVTYDGALLLDPGTPVSELTGYFGTTQAAQLRWRWAGTVDAVAGFEYEIWGRRLSSSQEETFRTWSLRLGGEHLASARHPFVAGGGVRFMLTAEEQTRVEYSGSTFDVELEPEVGSNPYLHAGYRVAPHLTLLGYWDSMHLGRSSTVTLITPQRTTIYVWQPASDMWRMGVRIVYRW
jgi:hypothetical protein